MGSAILCGGAWPIEGACWAAGAGLWDRWLSNGSRILVYPSPVAFADEGRPASEALCSGTRVSPPPPDAHASCVIAGLDGAIACAERFWPFSKSSAIPWNISTSLLAHFFFTVIERLLWVMTLSV